MSFKCVKKYEDSYDKYVLVATSEKVVLPDYLDKESKKLAETIIKKNTILPSLYSRFVYQALIIQTSIIKSYPPSHLKPWLRLIANKIFIFIILHS